MATKSVTRVLVVDDSAYVRKVVSQILSRSPFLEVVGTARDGQEALEQVVELRPDVVTCDLIMPNLDGVGFVREQMQRKPVPIVIVSVASESGELVLSALDAGAVDFIQKPTALASDRLLEMGDDLIGKVKIAAGARLRPPAPVEPIATARIQPRGVVDIVVLGISTGGPQALRSLIPRLPAALPVPLAIVLHMPIGYTELYARKLDELSALNVVEAEDGVELRSGSVFLAPAGRHLTLRRNAEGTVITHLDVRPLDMPHRPSVDVLFQSAADVYCRPGARRGDDRNGVRRPRRRRLDQGKGRDDPHRSRGDLRGVRHAALGGRGGTERSVGRTGRHGRRDSGASVKRKLLLVDDSGLARRSMRAMLESDGYEVVEAEDGIGALERYFLEKPDVVLLDLVMKGMYGLDVLTKLRELDASACVIVVSADVQSSSQQLVEAAGASGFLNKPVNRQELLNVLHTALEGRS